MVQDHSIRSFRVRKWYLVFSFTNLLVAGAPLWFANLAISRADFLGIVLFGGLGTAFIILSVLNTLKVTRVVLDVSDDEITYRGLFKTKTIDLDQLDGVDARLGHVVFSMHGGAKVAIPAIFDSTHKVLAAVEAASQLKRAALPPGSAR